MTLGKFICDLQKSFDILELYNRDKSERILFDSELYWVTVKKGIEYFAPDYKEAEMLDVKITHFPWAPKLVAVLDIETFDN